MFSKRKSSSKLIYLILGLLISASLFFTLSGAWYTSSAQSEVTGNTFTFVLGNFGDVELSVSNYTWQDINGHNIYPTAQAKNTANDNTGIVRTAVMPGDLLQSGNVSLIFDRAGTSLDTTVYYLIEVDGSYYTISNGALAAAPTNAGTITAGVGNALVINGSIVSVTTPTATYQLDGSNSTSTSSFKIDNWAQGKTLVQAGASIGGFTMDANGVIYKVAVIQYSNMTASTARGLLIDELDAMS